MITRKSLSLRLLMGIVVVAAMASCSPAAGPAATATPEPAPTSPPRPMPLPLLITVSVSRQADGTSVVRDIGNAYQFTLTQEWMAIPLSKEQIGLVAQASPAQDPEFVRLAQELGEKSTDAFRVVGVNTDSKFARAENPTLLLVTAIPDGMAASLPMPDVARMIQDTVFSGAADVQSDVVRNANGLDIAVVEGPYDYVSTQGETPKTSSRVIGFQANARVILIQFITPQDFGAQVLPGTDQIIDTIQRTKP